MKRIVGPLSTQGGAWFGVLNPNRLKWIFALLILATIPLVACSQSEGEETTQAPTQAIDTGVSTTNPTLALTSTSQPSTTSDIVPTSTQTPEEYESPDSELAATVVAAGEMMVLESNTSPNGNWRAEVARYDCVPVGEEDELAYEELTLIDWSNNQETLVAEQLQYCGGLGAFGLSILQWSLDSRYLYYNQSRQGVPDGACGPWIPPLNRYDTSSGENQLIGPGVFSPDQNKLVVWQGGELIFWDVNGEEIGRTEVEDNESTITTFAWSPDSQALIYLQNENQCPPYGNSTLTQVGLPGLDQTVLLETQNPVFGDLRWEDPERIDLIDSDGQVWFFYPASGELIAS